MIQEGTGPASYDVVKGIAGGSEVPCGFRPGRDKISLYGYQQSDAQVTAGFGFTLLSMSDSTKIQIVGVADPGDSIVG